MDKTKNAVEVFDYYAQLYQDKYMDVSLYHDTLDYFSSALEKKEASILELACGPGNLTKYLLTQRPDFKILATDLSPKMLELASANNPTAEFKIMDCRSIDQLDKSYDGLVCGFCLPYLSKEESLKLIKDASERLNENGVLYISTMEDDYSKSSFKSSSSDGDKKVFTHYHEADYLLKSLEENEMTLLHLERKEYGDGKGELVKDLIIIAKK